MSLRKKYLDNLQTKLQKDLNIKNKLSVPRLTKIVVNIGMGEALKDKKAIEEASRQLQVITGQKPKVTVSKRAISGFKIRAGMPIGLKVTLRGDRMYAFFEKLVSIVLTRMRDFRGVSKKGFDGQGNFSIGFPEQIVFPEIEYGKIDKTRGLEVTIVTSSASDEEAEKLLNLLGMPFKKEEEK